jgi:hypothetical protein
MFKFLCGAIPEIFSVSNRSEKNQNFGEQCARLKENEDQATIPGIRMGTLNLEGSF